MLACNRMCFRWCVGGFQRMAVSTRTHLRLGGRVSAHACVLLCFEDKGVGVGALLA